MEVKVFAIIVSYRGMKWYDRCLSSLRNSTLPLSIIVVDNNSADGSVDYIKANYPDVILIESKENLGFGRANNLGMRYAIEHGCDYVFLLNQDAWIVSDAVSTLVSLHKSNPEYGLLSPMHTTLEENQLNMTLDDGNRNFEMLSDIYFSSLKEVYPVHYVNAAAWLLPASTLKTIGGFCPLIFHYGEDDDYLNRMRYHGIKIGVCPSSRIIHDSSHRLENSASLANKANREGMHEFLNINTSNSISYLKRYCVRKIILCLLNGDASKRVFYTSRYKILAARGKDIINCRRQHMIKQPNWLQ